MEIRRNFGFAFFSVLIIGGLIGVACGGGFEPTGAAGPAATSVDSGEGGSLDAGGAAVAPKARTAPDVPAVLGEFQLPGITQRIIKTASVTVEVRKASFQQRFQEAAMVASRYGGFISSSRTTAGPRPSGVLVIRIPASQFEAAIGELKGLGTVKGEAVSGEDVTAQFVDLQARLRNWEAQEAVLLRLMRQSKTIEDSLKVQRTLQDVQLAIEEIRGQLRVLGDQTELSTITLSMVEAAVAAPKPKEEGLTFARAWKQAIHAIAAVFSAIVIGLGYVLPILLIAFALLLMWLGYRRLRPRVASSEAPTGTA